MPQDTDRPLHEDPVADQVADAIRESRGQLVWEREFPASPPPSPELLLRFGGPNNNDNYIRITGYGSATCCVLSRHRDQDTARREAPAAILAKLRQAVADLAKIVEGN
jgi:hypothetical protein